MNEKKQELLPDILRGFAIILVVFGHCIQAGSGASFRDNSLYFQDKLYQLIYSFHMPLFMLIAGYFARQSIDRAIDSKQRVSLLKRRTLSLLVPILFWTFFEFVYSYLLNMICGTPNSPLSFLTLEFIKKLLVNFWFLWAAFWCFLAMYIMHYYLRDSLILYTLVILSFFVLPDGMNLGVYKYTFVYYLAAFYLTNYIRNEDNYLMKKLSTSKNLCIYTVISGMLFAVLFLFYDEQCFIYTTGFHFIGKNIPLQIGIDVYRILIGFVGSGFVILLGKLLIQLFPQFRFPLLTLFGRNSMGIYILSGYVLMYGLVKITDRMEASYLLNIVTSIIILIISTLLTLILKQIPRLSWIIGKPNKNSF